MDFDENKFKTKEQLESLNTKRLLSLYRAEYLRYLRYRRHHLCECCGEHLIYNEQDRIYGKLVDKNIKIYEKYLSLMKSILNNREHIKKKKYVK